MRSTCNSAHLFSEGLHSKRAQLLEQVHLVPPSTLPKPPNDHCVDVHHEFPLADVKLDRTTTLSGRSLAALSTAQESIVWSLVSVQRGYELTGTGMGASRGLRPRTRSSVLQRPTTSLCTSVENEHGHASKSRHVWTKSRWPSKPVGWVGCESNLARLSLT